MRVSLEWLREYVDFALDADGLAELLSMSGTAVDRIIRTGGGVSGVVVAKVVEVRSHPNADNLKVAIVDDGSAVREVVCGAPNLRSGMTSALAVPGARLPAVSGKELRRATIRGVESDGMLVSAVELGIGEDASGIMELEDAARVGLDLNELLPLQDVVLDLEITPNRPDCMSMVGVAREVAALTGGELRVPAVELDETGGPIEDLVTVIIEDPRGCPRYTARAVVGVKVAPSPQWMQRRLLASGLRPINNLVDVTNYVLMEVGQPLHAFDLELLVEKTIVVRSARRGETILTLDGIERQIDDQTLVIADIETPVAMAGVMGGEDSEVTDYTRNVLIESAHFDPTSIYLTSKRLGIRTEASSRFERGTDPEGTVYAARRAAGLIAGMAGGKVAAGEFDAHPVPVTPVKIDLRASRVNRLIGIEISPEEIADILNRLEARTEPAEVMSVAVPTFRPDLEREIDLIEEIARVHGYALIPESLPSGGGINAGLQREQRLQAKAVDALAAQGMLEVMTYSFMRLADIDLLRITGDDNMRRSVRLVNPLAETGEVMRTTLLPGLVRAASGNINRGNRDLALFELGRVFHARGPAELPEEVECIGLLLCGLNRDEEWAERSRVFDFFDLKGIVENLCGALGAIAVSFAPMENPYLAPGRAARLLAGGEDVGVLGELHPDVIVGFGIEGEFFVAELLADVLFRHCAEAPRYRPVGRFPNVKVDIALVVDEGLEARLVEDEIMRNGGEHLRSVRLFDVYRGKQVPSGRKSLAFALEFESEERTLTDEEAHRVVGAIIDAVERSFGAVLRGRRPLSGGEA